MFRLFLLSLIFAFTCTDMSFAAPRTITTRTPVYNSHFNHYQNPHHRYNHNRISTRNHKNFHNNSHQYYNNNRLNSFSDLNALEKYSLNRNYRGDSRLQRLERLENQAFGAIQSGDIDSRYERVRNAILARPKINQKTSLLRNLGNFFAGQTTGFTPSLTPSLTPSFTPDPFFNSSGFMSSPYPNTHGTSSIQEYSGPFGRGYRINNFGTGSSSGIRILD